MNASRPRYALFILMLIYSCSVMDRSVLTVVLEPLRKEFGLSDSALGLLSGMAFAIFYSMAGLPLGAAADRLNRRNIIAACLFIWTGTTALCGLAGSFLQLLLTRIWVAVGEAGGQPASMSMISDLFPADRRARAASGFYLASSAGAFASFAGGGWVAEHYGWRAAFLLAAVPGPILVGILLLTIREPARGGFDGTAANLAPPSLRATLRFISSQPSLCHVMAGVTLTVLTVSGISAWSASFFVRTHGFSLAQIGPILGVTNGVVGLSGTITGGMLADGLAARDERWRCWILALAALFTAPMIGALALAQGGVSAVMFFVCFTFVSFIWYGPAYALVQTLVQPRMRGRTSAIANLLSSLLGSAVGPQMVGFLSDIMRSRFGVESLRYALLATCVTSMWAAAHFLLAARTLRGDIVSTENNVIVIASCSIRDHS